MQGCAIAVEAFATERLIGPELPRARARAALAVTARPDSLVEWLPGRVALARAAASVGDIQQARNLLAQVDRLCSTRHRDVWAGLVQVAAVEVEELAESRHRHGRHPAGMIWRRIASSVLRRIWQERDARFADLRHRILNNQLLQRRQQTDRQLFMDPLTGLDNRDRLEAELATRQSGTVLFLDLDNFKQINDRIGHPVGDEVLRRTGALLRSCCRSTDIVARYGGDEFVVLVEDATRAAELAERIVQRFRDEEWQEIAEGLDLTVSVGIARAVGGVSALERSDVALRQAKQIGRDVVVHL
jgi:diguanylate cyclase (GGDEF)-like protein